MLGLILCELLGYGAVQADSTSCTQTLSVYDTEKPDWSPENMGYYDTGIALADIDGDGWNDIVVSNGNDKSPQPLVVYYSRGAPDSPEPFGKRGVRPDWYSRDYDYHMHLAVGDIDKDGCLDVAVAVPFDKDLNYRGGRVKVYFNKGRPTPTEKCRGLEELPSYETDAGFSTIGCALGDADGDGYLDLAVAVMTEDAGVFDPAPGKPSNGTPAPTPGPAQARIYFNHNGVLERSPRWRSDEHEKMYSTDAQFADVDQNGTMDLVLAAPQPTVYFGAADGSGIQTTSGWRAKPFASFAYSIDVGRVARASTLALAVSYTPFFLAPGAQSYPFLIYLPQPDGTHDEPVWHSDPPDGAGSRVAFADVDRDGRLDLVAGRWADAPISKVKGAAIRVFLGNDDTYLCSAPAFVSKTQPVSETIAIGSLAHRSGTGMQRFVAKSAPAQSVLTLSEHNVERIVSVKRNETLLSANHYAWVPGANWVSLSQRLSDGDVVEISYEMADHPDLAVADWKPEGPLAIYYNKK